MATDYETYYNPGNYCVIPGSGATYCQERYCKSCSRFIDWDKRGRPEFTRPAIVVGKQGVMGRMDFDVPVVAMSPEMPVRSARWVLLIDPDPYLRWASKPVVEVDGYVREVAAFLVSALGESPEDSGVAGCAAPQFGVHLRIIAFWRDPLTSMVCINPSVTAKGTDTAIVREGCISLPGQSFWVRRPTIVKFRATNLDGRAISLKMRDRDAGVVCHEVDHLDGILCSDRAKELEEETK